MARGLAVAFLGLACGGFLFQAQADGFRNPPDGAAVLGRGGVRLTQVDDPSAVIHNPANLAGIERPQTMASVTFAYADAEFTSPLGVREDSKAPWNFLPAVFAAMPLEDGRFVLGVGLHVPYGQAKEWERDGVFKFMAPHYAEMRTFNLSPALATRLGESLAVGVGLDLMWSDLKFRQQFPFLPPPAGLFGPGTELKFEGDGTGLGAHIGLTWDVREGHRLALSYRSPVSVEYEGDFEMNPYPGPAVFPPPLSGDSDFETEIDFPQVVAIGYGLRLTEQVTVEFNVEWVEHSRNESLDLDIENNNALLLAALGTTSLRQDWDDTWTFGVGGDWAVNPEWTLRAGYTWLPTPIPDATVAPTLPESDKHVLALGLGFERERHRADFAYAYNILEDRDITDAANPVQGSYEIEQHLLMASYSMSF